jgi:hypothetical protein
MANYQTVWLPWLWHAPKNLSTAEIYGRIKKLWLPTVEFEKYNKITDISLAAIQQFVQKNKPCLFIFDPKTPEVHKWYLFWVTEFREILDWVDKNRGDFQKYTYLITTQIENPGSGFVWSVFTNGKGNLFIETLHTPWISNHRALSQSGKEDISNFRSDCIIEHGEMTQARGNFLQPYDIKKLTEIYGHLEWYFEFVKWVQTGIRDYFTTGYEPFHWMIQFPAYLYKWESLNLRAKIKASALRQL